MTTDIELLKTRAAHTHILLVHYPVLNRNGKVVTTAVTNLDIHDISRLSKSYGIASYHIITPIELQRELVKKVIGHWTEGWGSEHNPTRSEAFQNTIVTESVAESLKIIRDSEEQEPLVVATSAKKHEHAEFVSYTELLKDPRPLVLMFGTGWGMAPSLHNISRTLE